ncbi:MAG TPA: hypothetical protein VMA34_16950 [Terracidiphilus sp.]|nr:hypothetical protein [Terracidiphilus sp.]
MPRPSREDDDEEQAALIDEMIESRWFHGTGAETRVRILRFLFLHRREESGFRALTIGLETLPDPARKSKNIDKQKLADSTRHHLEELRRSISQYNLRHSANQKWRVELEQGNSKGGHRLRFIQQQDHPRVTIGFWWEHIRSGKCTVVCNAPLFYRDPVKQMVFRFVEINQDEMNSELALARLKRDHPDLYHDGVYVSHLYLLRGETDARDTIQRWFADAASLTVGQCISYQMAQKDIDDCSPILLGNPRTNPFIREFLNNDGRHLEICMDMDSFGSVTVKHSSPEAAAEERKRLSARKPALLMQCGPGTTALLNQPPRESERDAFAVVTRVPNPSGEGVITILASDQTRALGQVARTLTDDDWLLQALRHMGWRAGDPAPASFQGLFVVRLRGSEAAKPELLTWRTYGP